MYGHRGFELTDLFSAQEVNEEIRDRLPQSMNCVPELDGMLQGHRILLCVLVARGTN